MTTKLRLDIVQGILEVEGGESFVREMYEDFKSLREATPASPSIPKKRSQPAKKESAQSQEAKKRSPTKNRNADLKVVKDLDLSGKGKSKSLKQYVEGHQPKTNMERNLVFVSYLVNELGLKGEITTNHVFTCYRMLPDTKIPGAVVQSLLDTAHRKTWIDTSTLDDIQLTTHGINHIEHEMRSQQ